MPIGKLVKAHIRQIFAYCDTVDHAEIDALLDKRYSATTFKISFPFCAEVDSIEPSQSKRFWTEIYLVRGKRVRVSSQWVEKSDAPFRAYLLAKGIATETELADFEARAALPGEPVARASSRVNARYRGNAIGNAQNLFVRNVLSNLGDESFSERDWVATQEWFAHRCAYCGAEAKLVIEHAIPINRQALGEHRLGNLVPSCDACNKTKGDKDFREFLGENAGAIARIEQYMDSRNYVPLQENEQVTMVLNMAHREVAALAERYVRILNELFISNSGNNGPTDPTS